MINQDEILDFVSGEPDKNFEELKRSLTKHNSVIEEMLTEKGFSIILTEVDEETAKKEDGFVMSEIVVPITRETLSNAELLQTLSYMAFMEDIKDLRTSYDETQGNIYTFDKKGLHIYEQDDENIHLVRFYKIEKKFVPGFNGTKKNLA